MTQMLAQPTPIAYPKGWHDPETLSLETAQVALCVVNMDIATGTAFYDGSTREEVEAYRDGLQKRLEKPIFDNAELEYLIDAIGWKTEANNGFCSVLGGLLEKKLKTMLEEMK